MYITVGINKNSKAHITKRGHSISINIFHSNSDLPFIFAAVIITRIIPGTKRMITKINGASSKHNFFSDPLSSSPDTVV